MDIFLASANRFYDYYLDLGADEKVISHLAFQTLGTLIRCKAARLNARIHTIQPKGARE